ncbi:MAG: strictosidine synthase [Alphaproteobacteria bacterium]|nr:MAG: strictosidine synthase [Alphaproteobacteria bacterium]
MSTTSPKFRRRFSSSILLWMRSNQPRETGMNYWKGPHSKIISAAPGLDEYRQVHLAETNPGLWPKTFGVETTIPAGRKIDGVAQVAFHSVFSVLAGREQNKLAFKDEINVFRRTLLYIGLPNWSRWYDVARPNERIGTRVLVYCRRRDGVSAGAFRSFVNDELAPALAATAALKEPRTETFLPWSKGLWNTPNVAHDNPSDQRFHASMMLGFTDAAEQGTFFESLKVGSLSTGLDRFASAVHAYQVAEALTFVRDGAILPHYQE